MRRSQKALTALTWPSKTLKAMFAELLDGAKQDILAQVKGSIDQVLWISKVLKLSLRMLNPVQRPTQMTTQLLQLQEKLTNSFNQRNLSVTRE